MIYSCDLSGNHRILPKSKLDDSKKDILADIQHDMDMHQHNLFRFDNIESIPTQMSIRFERCQIPARNFLVRIEHEIILFNSHDTNREKFMEIVKTNM